MVEAVIMMQEAAAVVIMAAVAEMTPHHPVAVAVAHI